jgi:alcohol dehydrogenase class IV
MNDSLVEFRIGCIIAIGGGSVLDLAKVIKYHRNLSIPMVAIPSTLGSGAESTEFATYFEDGVKKSYCHPELKPSVVVLDPSICLTLPQSTIRSSGLDTFAHSIESYWSIQATRSSQRDSLCALNLVFRNFAGALKCQEEGIANMQVAAFLAGRAINIAKTTASHALSYYLTARMGVAHGTAVGLNLAGVCRYNESCPVGENQAGFSHDEIRNRLEDLKEILSDKIEIPLSHAIHDFILMNGGQSGMGNYAEYSGQIAQTIQSAQLSNRFSNNPRIFNSGALHESLFQNLSDRVRPEAGRYNEGMRLD